MGLSRFGAKVVTTNLLGALITIATVVLINEQLGEATVGHYRSVLVIAEGYTVAVSLAVQQDLFPRLTRAASDKEEFSGQVVEQIRLFITLYVPLALTLMVLAVPVLTILFSGEFIPAQRFLRWRLAGDLFRIVGSVLTTSLLAARPPRTTPRRRSRRVAALVRRHVDRCDCLRVCRYRALLRGVHRRLCPDPRPSHRELTDHVHTLGGYGSWCSWRG